MIRKFFTGLLLVLLPFISLASFEVLDETDPVRHFDFNDEGEYTLTSYNALQAYLDAYDATSLFELNFDDILLYYKSTPSRNTVVFYLNDTDVGWDWKAHPHAYIAAEHDSVNSIAHPSDYMDIIHLLEGADYYDRDADDPSAIMISVMSNLQEMINAAREAYGLSKFPNSIPGAWVSHRQQTGGDWVKYGADVDDYYIANIDIRPSANYTNPARSSDFRRHNVRRYRHTSFDDNDVKTKLNFSSVATLEINEVSIGYDFLNIVNIKMANGQAIVNNLRSLTGMPWVSFEGTNQWYIAQVKSVSYNTEFDTMVLNCVPKAKKGTFSDNESLSVGIEQIDTE